ncbi:hypothetical protein KC359_g35 [Hortaea werneckii]|nr:hypothetical protein KC359_g35 [Hortaea werneckii]
MELSPWEIVLSMKTRVAVDGRGKRRPQRQSKLAVRGGGVPVVGSQPGVVGSKALARCLCRRSLADRMPSLEDSWRRRRDEAHDRRGLEVGRGSCLHRQVQMALNQMTKI